MRPIVLCRDGVINRIPKGNIRSPDDWHALPGSLRAIARLTFAHFNVIVVTNQPDIGEGGLDSGTLARIHAKMKTEAAREGGRIDALLYCPHRIDEACPCRMPKPGLLVEIGRRLDMDLGGIPFVSDSLDNIHMARSLGMRAMLIDPERCRRMVETPSGDVTAYPDLGSVADAVIRQTEAA